MKPENIYAAKLHRPVPSGIQMQFVDVGLMPALERNAGEALNRLVTQAIHSLMIELDGKVRSRADHEGVYKSVFWLLAAKLLKEKAVKGFKSLDLNDIRSVFAVVGSTTKMHATTLRETGRGGRRWPALHRVSRGGEGWAIFPRNRWRSYMKPH